MEKQVYNSLEIKFTEAQYHDTQNYSNAKGVIKDNISDKSSNI